MGEAAMGLGWGRERSPDGPCESCVMEPLAEGGKEQK